MHSNGGSGANSPQKGETISEEEKRHIAEILRKADQSKRMEEARIEQLRSKVQALKIQTRGDGYHTCLLCGDALSFFRRSAKCDICNERFCDKCTAKYETRTGTMATMCRVCHEKREVWKRSGAWQNGDVAELISENAPTRSASILSNSSSTKSGVVDPNVLLGQTGWRRYRSIHGQTTVVRPGRTGKFSFFIFITPMFTPPLLLAVLSENADSDSDGEEFESQMIGRLPSMTPIAPQTEQLPRKQFSQTKEGMLHEPFSLWEVMYFHNTSFSQYFFLF